MCDNNMTVDAYGSDSELLPITRKIVNQVETIEIQTHLPNTVMCVLSGSTILPDEKKSIELLSMSLAGVKINQEILPNIIDYRPNLSTQVQQYVNYPSIDQIVWNHDGCVIFDLFDPNPFAYLLKIGNKIKF
jgi:hypothetical protein